MREKQEECPWGLIFAGGELKAPFPKKESKMAGKEGNGKRKVDEENDDLWKYGGGQTKQGEKMGQMVVRYVGV